MNAPQDILEEIKLREGCKNVAYMDTANPPNPTGGFGHKLTAQERSWYKPGTPIPQAVIETWLNNDSLHAYRDALAMASQIGVSDPNLIRGLTCAAFQMGDHIPSEFPTLWAFLMAHQWAAAAEDAGKTLWDRQTPLRVKDFQDALLAIGGSA